MFYMPFYTFRRTTLHSSGYNNDLWSFSVSSFTALIMIVTAKLLVTHRYFHWLNAVAFFLITFLCYFSYVWISNFLTISQTYLAIENTFNSPLFYFILIFCFGTAFSFDFAFVTVSRVYRPSPSIYMTNIAKNKN